MYIRQGECYLYIYRNKIEAGTTNKKKEMKTNKQTKREDGQAELKII
jgi:hypothetical protein